MAKARSTQVVEEKMKDVMAIKTFCRVFTCGRSVRTD